MSKLTSFELNEHFTSVEEISPDTLLEKLFAKFDFDNNRRISKF